MPWIDRVAGIPPGCGYSLWPGFRVFARPLDHNVEAYRLTFGAGQPARLVRPFAPCLPACLPVPPPVLPFVRSITNGTTNTNPSC
jgi:hypothetical protein